MPTFDLNGVVESFAFPGGITITRRGTPTRSHGLVTADGTRTTWVADPAFAHPVTGRALNVLPEGLRSHETLALYTTDALRTALDPAGAQGDLVAYNGLTYEVQVTERWADNGAYYRSLATKVPVT